LANTKIFNLYKKDNDWQGGWKHSGNNTGTKYQETAFNTIYEVIMPNTSGVCSIMLSPMTFNKMEHHTKEEEKKKLFSINEFFKIINDHTDEYLDKEIAFFNKYPTDETDRIIESLNAIKSQIPQNNSYCILKMSAGSGAHSITGDIWHDDYSVSESFIKGKKVFEQAPKSRKIVICNGVFSLMGFVKLQVITDEDVAKRRQALKEQREKVESEKQAAREHIAEQQKKLDDYNDLINAAQNLFDGGKYDEAKVKIDNASKLLPENKKHEELFAKINIELQKIQDRKNREDNLERSRQQAEAIRLAANQVPLAEKIGTSNKIPTLAGNIKTWMKFNNIELLSEDDIEVVHAKVQEIYGSLKNREKQKFNLKPLEEIIGEEKVNQWNSLLY
jgi:hypothetical protein